MQGGGSRCQPPRCSEVKFFVRWQREVKQVTFAGLCFAAQFIKRFVKPGVKWAHLDIAGTVWSNKAGTLHDKGATGYGVRLLDRFIAANFEA